MNSQNEAVLTPEEQILITRLKSFRFLKWQTHWQLS